MSDSYCFFCDRHNPKKRILAENDEFYAHLDDFPVSPGHCEVVPKRHIESYFDLSDEEVLAMHELLHTVRGMIDREHAPDAYNIGVNDGIAAGRSIHHLHIHLIPRYSGDVEHPRGGVRHIIPGKGNY